MRVTQGMTTAFVLCRNAAQGGDGCRGDAEEGDEDACALTHVLVRQIVKGPSLADSSG